MKDNSSTLVAHCYKPSKNHKCGKNKLNIDSSFIHSQQHQDAVLTLVMSQYSQINLAKLHQFQATNQNPTFGVSNSKF